MGGTTSTPRPFCPHRTSDDVVWDEVTNIVDAAPDPAALPLDAPVSVAFEPRGAYKLPVFRLVEA